MSSIKELLAVSTLDKVDAKVLLAHLIEKYLSWPKSSLISRDTDALPKELVTEWLLLEARRNSGEPVAYILGKKEFYNIELKVAPGVLIPRPETELLVELAIEHLHQEQMTTPRILDLGTGSGAIALAIAKNLPGAKVIGIDLSEPALAIAKENAQLLGLDQQVSFSQGSWFEALSKTTHRQNDGLFDLIVSNPPYIAAGDHHLSEGDLRFEPDTALTDFNDGLSAYRLISGSAKEYLNKNGLIALEHGYNQSLAVSDLLQEHGFVDIKVHHDLAGIARAASAKLR